jgi:hypothetical protein
MPILLLAALMLAGCLAPNEPDPEDANREAIRRAREGAPMDPRCAPGGYWTTFSWGEGCAYPDIKPIAH